MACIMRQVVYSGCHYERSPAVSAYSLLQTFVHNLIGGFDVQHKGAALDPSQPSTLGAFEGDPDSMRVELQPIVDEAANTQQIITIQVGPGPSWSTVASPGTDCSSFNAMF